MSSWKPIRRFRSSSSSQGTRAAAAARSFPRLVLLLPALLLSCALQGCLSAPPSPITVTGMLQGDHRWSGRILIVGDVLLEEGGSLVVEPGTEVLFAPAPDGLDSLREHPHFPGSELIVRGRMIAEGEPEHPIVFRFLDSEGTAGSWGGINLQQSPWALFRYCRFTQADSALHSQESEVVVEESRFDGNLVGLRFHSSALLVENSTFTGNDVAVRFHFGSPVLCRNDIRGNRLGVFVTSHPREVRFENNNLIDNREGNVVLGEEVPENLVLPGNFWGATDPTEIEKGFFDGRRVDYLGRIDYRGWRKTPVPGAGASWRP